VQVQSSFGVASALLSSPFAERCSLGGCCATFLLDVCKEKAVLPWPSGLRLSPLNWSVSPMRLVRCRRSKGAGPGHGSHLVLV
jgi:hypothetical protein